MGTVYLGEDDPGQKVAIKVINAEYSQHEQFRMRFRREADAAQRVRRFCTAAVLEAALDGDQLYVVTEYVPGPNLEEAVAASGPLRDSSLDALAVGVATALTAIHGAGVVHRDLKPSNVLLSPVGPRVIDFGIARALDSLGGVTGTGELIGTPRYMAPEVLRGEAVSPACDVFSWACLVAFAASGNPPFGGEALHAVLYQVLNTEPVIEGMDPGLHELVVYGLSKDPARRPTAQQLLDHMVGRAAAPEQTAHSVQAAWQQQAPPLQPTAPWPGVAAGPPPYPPQHLAQNPAQNPPSPGTTMRQTLAPTHPGGPGPAAVTGRRKLAIGAVVALLMVGGASLGLYKVLGGSGPPEGLALLYQDDFTATGTGWKGGTYTGPPYGNYGYTPQGFYAMDVTGGDPVQRETAPLPYVPQQPATPSPGATPTPTTPERLLLGVDTAIRKGTTGVGEYGLYCRGADETDATRYEFLLDTAGNARIRKVQENAGGDLGKVSIGGVPGQETKRLQAECTGDETGVTLTMWVDGDEALSVTDADAPLVNGEVGILTRVGEKSTATLKASFDNFTVHGPKPGTKSP
ncbi:protein kinase [Streptosporangium sp. KLBMP 9127]|nr:protein kinase [Streptosporangium sp. KLBMP 9127]